MDDPLVPESLSGNTKYVVYGGVGSTLLFIAISIIMTVVYGSKKGHPGYYVLALAMLGILITVLVLLNWVRQNTVEDKLKYIVGFQLFLLVLLSIGALIEILQKPVTCDPCPPPVRSICEQQLISGLSNSVCQTQISPTTQCGPAFYPTACFTEANYVLAGNGSLTIGLVPPPLDDDEPETLSPAVLAAIADVIPAAAAAAPATAKSQAAPLIPVRSPPRGTPTPAPKQRAAPVVEAPSKGSNA